MICMGTPMLGHDLGADFLDKPDIAPENAGLHAGHGVGADHRLRFGDVDMRQGGGSVVQRLKRLRFTPGAITPPI